MAIVDVNHDKENIDLLPMGWLNERGCEILWGDEVSITTPSPHSRQLLLGCWEGLPYLDCDQIKVLMDDLPKATEEGRSGSAATTRVHASRAVLGPRACALQHKTSSSQSCETLTAAGPRKEKEEVRKERGELRHLNKSPASMKSLKQKYRCMNNEYGDSLSPEEALKQILGRAEGTPEVRSMWETCAGSGKLSARARSRDVSHLPPVDYRWGWDLGRARDQLISLWLLLCCGCRTLFCSPTCTPWSANSKAWEADTREHQRGLENMSVQFVTVMCLLQAILGRWYMVENPTPSDIFRKSALGELQKNGLEHYQYSLDQCMYGAEMERCAVKKATTLLTNRKTGGLTTKCSKDHLHIQLRGSNGQGARTAQAGVFPDKLCDTLIEGFESAGEGELQASATPYEIFRDKQKDDECDLSSGLGRILFDLREKAEEQNLGKAWAAIVGPWIMQHRQLCKEYNECRERKEGRYRNEHGVKTGESSAERSANLRAADSEAMLEPDVEPGSTTKAKHRACAGVLEVKRGESSAEQSASLRAADSEAMLEPQMQRSAETGESQYVSDLPETPGASSTDHSGAHNAGRGEDPKDQYDEFRNDLELEDLVAGAIPEEGALWQFQPHGAGQALWQSAGQRRHQHRRRTNNIVGCASVDLSGPHQPTPMVGGKVGSKQGHYFLVLHLRPD